ncbi:lamin tail domain-containing protein [Halorussus amylolyticus]|uniref:lamin tail domain-containing protein n=1 Tax=Halorussus amylolyticus TaxID=1126242 RepID=UPI00104FCC61|nr:lamin tail domain-containing protein [Halorussus amylolyticus]
MTAQPSWATRTTTDHDTIREWVERRNATPTAGRETESDADRRALGIDFPDAESDEDFEPVAWDAFFETLGEASLAFRYKETNRNGEQSRFYRFVRREETGVADPVGGDASVVAVATEPVPTDSESGSEQGSDDDSETDPARGSTAEGVPDGVLDSEPRPATKLTVGLVVDEIHEDAGGYDHWNRNDEYLVFRNDGDEPLALAGWTVENADGETYEFPDEFVLEPNRAVTLRTGSGPDTDRDLHWGSPRAVWKNTGDVLTVRNRDGTRVIRESY